MNKKLILPLLIGAGIGIYFLLKKNKSNENIITIDEKPEEPLKETPLAPKPRSPKKPITKYAIFNKGAIITPKIPNRIMYLYTIDNKLIGETKKAIVIKQIEASPEWLLVSAKVLSGGKFPILIDKTGYVLTNTAK